MLSELQRLLSKPLTLRSLWAIQAAATKAACDATQPLPYFLVGSIAGQLASGMEGGPVSPDASQVRDEILRPVLLELIEVAESPHQTRLLEVANTAVRSYLLSK